MAPRGHRGSGLASFSRSAACATCRSITFVGSLPARAATCSTRWTRSSRAWRSTSLRPGRSAWVATFSAPTICSPMRCCCASAASTTGRSNRSAAMASTIRTSRVFSPKSHSPNCAMSRDGEGLCPSFDTQAYREGHLTPVYFGSAFTRENSDLIGAGVREFIGPLRARVRVAQPPREHHLYRWAWSPLLPRRPSAREQRLCQNPHS
jgi:hypothetical protein